MTKAISANRIWLTVAIVILAVGLGCSTKSPTAPQQTPAPPGGTPPSAFWNITVDVSPDVVALASPEPARVSVRVRNVDDNSPPPQGTTIVISTSLGEFVSLGSGLSSLALSTTNGRAETLYFPGTIEGTAVITAQLESSAGQTGVNIREGVVAAFETANGEVNLSIQFINRSTGDPRRYFWDFGDGESSREENPAHLYPHPGDYVVRLRVERGTFTDEVTTPVFVVEPLFITDISPNAGVAGTVVQIRGQGFVRPLRVRFNEITTDVLSVSSGRTTLTARVPFVAEDFFDTIPCAIIDPVTLIETPGTIAVETLTDITVERIPVSPGNTSDTLINAFAIIPDDPACVAEAGSAGGTSSSVTALFSPPVCTAGVACGFSDSSSGSIVSWVWDFGDGGFSTAQAPFHTYALAGSYTATLTVSDGAGASDTTSATVTAS